MRRAYTAALLAFAPAAISLHGGVLVAAGALVLAGATDPSGAVDEHALRSDVYSW